MSALTRSALLAVLLEPLLGCPLGGAGGPTGTCPADAHSTGTAVSMIGGGDPTCPEWGCGTNSPTLADGIVFDELNVNGEPDRHGIRITKAIVGSVEVKLQIDRHRMSATATDGSGRVFANGGLFGMVISLEKDGLNYDIRIDGVDENTLRFWAGDTTEIVPFYRILTRIPGDQDFKAPMCRQNVATKEKIWEGVEHSAIAFAGDRYEPALKTVTDAEPDTPWFNLACAGTATAKMHLMRHTNAAAWTAGTWRPGLALTDGSAPFHTSTDERQAMLKMFGADYCGNGHPFTIDGQPLMYGDAKAWYPATPTSARLEPSVTPAYVGTIESLWGPNGAVCLDRPRLATMADVAAVCKPPPPCNGPGGVAGWEKSVHVISANPRCP